jgi:creatinine amidohydrolase
MAEYPGRVSDFRSRLSPVRQTNFRRLGEKRIQKYHHLKRSRRRANRSFEQRSGGSRRRKKVRTLVINWWSFASDETKEVFGEDGGHAGLNETAFIQAIDPTLVRKELYKDDLATPYPAVGTWSAVPFPSSIGLYQKGQGYPKFDQKKADEYYKKVTDKVASLVNEIVRKWDMAGL